MRELYAVQRHLQKHDEIAYQFSNGDKVTVTADNVRSLSTQQLQAVARFILKEQRRSKAETAIEQKGGSTREPVAGDRDSTKRFELVKQFIRNVQPEKQFQEERLHIPKVFQALMTQPHTAFDQTIKKPETIKAKLLILVDAYTGYFRDENADTSIVTSLICYPVKDKTVAIKTLSGERLQNRYMYDDKKIVKEHEKFDKILYFSQGCGTSFDVPKTLAKKTTFFTIFNEGCDCGCDRIHAHERAGCKMYYGVRSWNDLLSIR